MFPCSGVGPGVERGGARPPGEVRWARDERVCGCVSWDFGGREAAPRRVGVRVCRLGVCVCVCVSGGGSRPASPQGARVPGRVCVVRGPASGTPERRGLPASRPGLGSLAGENCSAGSTPGTREAVRPPRRRAAGARAAVSEARAAAGSAPACSAA